MCCFCLHFSNLMCSFKKKKTCCSLLLKKITCYAKRENKITCHKGKSHPLETKWTVPNIQLTTTEYTDLVILEINNYSFFQLIVHSIRQTVKIRCINITI